MSKQYQNITITMVTVSIATGSHFSRAKPVKELKQLPNVYKYSSSKPILNVDLIAIHSEWKTGYNPKARQNKEMDTNEWIENILTYGMYICSEEPQRTRDYFMTEQDAISVVVHVKSH